MSVEGKPPGTPAFISMLHAKSKATGEPDEIFCSPPMTTRAELLHRDKPKMRKRDQ